jgi:DNA-binding MarR family transcriptional regulator
MAYICLSHVHVYGKHVFGGTLVDVQEPQVKEPLGCAGAHGSDPRLAELDRAMLRIRRSQTRRSLNRIAARASECPPDHSAIAVADAVDEGPPEPGTQVTVGLVAERLGVDPSRASRLVTAAIDAGYVRRVASQRDARRIGLELTDAGRDALDAAQRFRQAMFGRAMHDWTEHERTEFVRLLSRFTDAFLDATGC